LDILQKLLSSLMKKEKKEGDHKEDRRDPECSTPTEGKRKKDKIN
jgi:hypothetical protein